MEKAFSVLKEYFNLKLFWTDFHNDLNNYITSLASSLVFLSVYYFSLFYFLCPLYVNLQYNTHGREVELPIVNSFQRDSST